MLATGFTTFLWSLLVIFFMVMYFMMLFRSSWTSSAARASGGKKALWLLFILFVPLIGLIDVPDRQRATGWPSARRRTSSSRKAAFDARQGRRRRAADQIAKAKELLDTGTITQAEFDQIKAKALA